MLGWSWHVLAKALGEVTSLEISWEISFLREQPEVAEASMELTCNDCQLLVDIYTKHYEYPNGAKRT